MLKKWLLCAFHRIVGATNHKFPFVYQEIEILGKTFSPIVSVDLLLPEKNWLSFEFLVDTGATATILPSFMAHQLGLKLEKLPEVAMAGVEGTGVKSWLGKVKMRLHQTEFSARCFFVDNPEVPFLLGRLDILDRYFSLKIDSRRQELVLKENSCP